LLHALERLFALLFFARKRSSHFPPPDPTRPVGSEHLPQIKHIVVLMMENHSYDNYFGCLKGRGEGFPDPLPTNPSKDGRIPAHHLEGTKQLHDNPTQSWTASHIQWDGGSNEGFPRSVEETLPGKDPRVPMGFWTGKDLPFYDGLARTFPLADHWYASCLGPTFPNRRFLIAGTANGLADDDLLHLVDYPRNGTIFDLLARYKISWVNYRSAPSPGVVLKRLLGVPGLRAFRGVGALVREALRRVGVLREGVQQNFQFTANLYPAGLLRVLCHVRPVEQFFRDARDGTLPAVSIVDPDYDRTSEENPQDILDGEAFAARVINAAMHGKGWADTLLVWCYDEHGGYYDHVPPPPAVEPDGVRARLTHDTGPDTYDRYGFRCPAAIVSPYARRNYVSTVAHDHTSILKLIETKWNLPSLTRRDSEADDLLDSLDLAGAPPFLEPPVLPPPARAERTSHA
jgi:phospholipase C